MKELASGADCAIYKNSDASETRDGATQRE